MRPKYYHVHTEAIDSEGGKHIVTVVGKFEQRHVRFEVKEKVPVEARPNKFVDGTLTFYKKRLYRKLTVSFSICHSQDEFNEEYGVKIAKGRINRGEDIGSLETSCPTMLTKDAIEAELLVKAVHISENIDDFLPIELEEEKQETKE